MWEPSGRHSLLLSMAGQLMVEMSNQRESSKESHRAPYEAIFAALPPLDSPEYLEHLKTTPASELPPQVLARAYRQLCGAKREDAMRATLDRLLTVDYLKSIRRLALQQVPPNQGWYGVDDLVQAALAEIVAVLPSERGAFAEIAWVRFCTNCFEDAWRRINGRHGEKLEIKIGDERVPITFVKPNPDDIGGADAEDADEEMPDDPVEATDGSAAPWHVGVKESELPVVEKIIEDTIAGIADSVMRRVAEDHFGDDPSPISSGTSAGGKPPLTEQTGLSRHQLTRMLKNLRGRLAGALLTDPKLRVDRKWLRKFVCDARNKVSNKSRRVAH